MEIQIVAGFLGAGKTTFLNRYIPTLTGTTVVIENEFGDVSIDSELIEGNLPVRELAAGCICCTLAADLRAQIRQIAEEYAPDRILIEPSGVARLSDVIQACVGARFAKHVDLRITKCVTIVDLEDYAFGEDGFGEFYMDQIAQAGLLLLRNQDEIEDEKRETYLSDMRKRNPGVLISTDDWKHLPGEILKELVEASADYECAACGEHHARGACRKEKNGEQGDLVYGKKDRGENRQELPVFESISVTEVGCMTEDALHDLMSAFSGGAYGNILRSKGIVPGEGECRLHFEYTRTTRNVTRMEEDDSGESKAIVIGFGLEKEKIRECFLGEEKEEVPCLL